MMRIVLATVCCRFGSWGLVIKLNFCSDFEHKVWSRFWSWISGKIWSRSLLSILLLMFCKGNEVESWSRFWGQVWSISWTLSLVEMLVTLVSRTQPSGPLCLWQCFEVSLFLEVFIYAKQMLRLAEGKLGWSLEGGVGLVWFDASLDFEEKNEMRAQGFYRRSSQRQTQQRIVYLLLSTNRQG